VGCCFEIAKSAQVKMSRRTFLSRNQDMGVPQMRFFAALAKRPDALFFAGDVGQRIFQQPFSWKELGIDIRGRSRTLRVNYRTSHQIRAQADRLLDSEVSDADGNVDKRRDTVSVFNGPAPEIRAAKTQAMESELVAAWLAARTKAGAAPQELGVFVRSSAELPRARAAVEKTIFKNTVNDRALFQGFRELVVQNWGWIGEHDGDFFCDFVRRSYNLQ